MKSESTGFFYYGSGLPIPLEARLASFIVAFQKLVEIGFFFSGRLRDGKFKYNPGFVVGFLFVG